MSLMPSSFNRNRSGKPKTRLNAKQRKLLAEHENWLRSKGLHRDQLSVKTKPRARVDATNSGSDMPKLSNTVVTGGFKKTIWDTQWRKTYEDDPLMAEREEDALRRAEKYKGRLMPLYNKGPVQLCTDLSTLKEGNGRGRN
jgi:hypothetical protein